jgi:hypothetical protein
MKTKAAENRKPIWPDLLKGICALLLTMMLEMCGLLVCVSGFYMPPCEKETGFFRKLACGMSDAFEGFAPYFRSLPSDEAMIAHFNKNRSDFEALVKIYIEDMSVSDSGVGILEPTPEIRAVMKRINAESVIGDDVLWIPSDSNPMEPMKNPEADALKPGDWRKFSGVILGYKHKTVARLKWGATVSKEYYYVPLIPQVEGGELRLPSQPAAWGNGTLVDSLNTYPPTLGPWDAAYRQIEPHWYIKMRQNK